MCSRATAWLLVEPRCRTVLAGTRFHSAPFSCAVALFFLLVLPCSFFLLFPSLSLSVSLSLSLLLRSVLQPLSSSHCREWRRACTRKGRKKKKSEAAEREEIGKGRQSRFLFFFSFSTSLFSHPPSLPSAPQTTNQRQASPAEAVKDAVEAVKDAVEDVKDAVVHAVEEAVSADDEEPAEAEAAPAVEVKVQTSPHDARFPATNQSRHCYTRYNEYYRCVAQKGEEDEECKFVSRGEGGGWSGEGEGKERREQRRKQEKKLTLSRRFTFPQPRPNKQTVPARVPLDLPLGVAREVGGAAGGRQVFSFTPPPFFFITRRRRPALEKGCPTTRISLVLFSTSTAQQQQQKCFLSTGAYAGKY